MQEVLFAIYCLFGVFSLALAIDAIRSMYWRVKLKKIEEEHRYNTNSGSIYEEGLVVTENGKYKRVKQKSITYYSRLISRL